MQDIYYSALEKRAILLISGADKRTFLQSLISNDMMRVSENRSIFAAFLSPQGKYQYDFFISQTKSGFFIDCERDRLKNLSERLSIFKLRADVSFLDYSDTFRVFSIWGPSALRQLELPASPGHSEDSPLGRVMVDPRLVSAGIRVITKSDHLSLPGALLVGSKDYDLHRLNLGLTDGCRDLIIDKSILLEANFDELNGVDWNKGCYLGQEVTARSRYRGLIKKRFIPVKISEGQAKTGDIIFSEDKKIGQIRSISGELAMAIINIEYLKADSSPYLSNDCKLLPIIPDWIKL